MDRARELIHQQLVLKPNDVRLHVLLGDVDKDPSMYEKAWLLSDETYATAQFKLARVARIAGDFDKALIHYELALNINPVDHEHWFAMAVCARETGDLQLAADVFTRCVSVKPDYGEAWNNLAVLHIELKHSDLALHALLEACKYIRDQWRLWDNIVSASLRENDVRQALSAVTHVFQLKHDSHKKESGVNDVDCKSFVVLTDRVLAELAALDRDSNSYDFLHEQYMRVSFQIMEYASDNPYMWLANGKFLLQTGNLGGAVGMYEAYWRVTQERYQSNHRCARVSVFLYVNLYVYIYVSACVCYEPPTPCICTVYTRPVCPYIHTHRLRADFDDINKSMLSLLEVYLAAEPPVRERVTAARFSLDAFLEECRQLDNFPQVCRVCKSCAAVRVRCVKSVCM
jgi:tetratricopeptide (TPR) repeat protein